jgi:hypothetical protein
MTERKRLSDILSLNSDRETLSKLWTQTAAAEERGPLPSGEYTFRILTGELFTSKQRSTPGYKLTLEVTEGEYEGRRAWCDFWLTPAALPMTKRDLAKIGIKDLEQLEKPLPPGILIRGKLTLRPHDDGNESNRLARFEFVGIEKGDAFEPEADEDDQAGAADPDTSFDTEALDADTDNAAGAAPDRGAVLEPAGNDETSASANGKAARMKRGTNP